MNLPRSLTGVPLRFAALTLILLSTVGPDAPRGAAPPYTVIDLGTFGTGQTAEALDVNDAGQVVGRAGTRAFLWTNGSKVDLGTLGSGSAASANGINEAGQVVGHSALTTPPTGSHATLWQSGITDLTPDLAANQGAAATAINEAGQVVGNMGSGMAFLWQNGARTLLVGLNGDPGFVNDINDGGVAVGSSLGRPVMWQTQTGRVTDLGLLSGDEDGGATAINSLGQIVGSSGRTDLETYETFYRPFIYSGGVMTAVPVPSTDAYAGDINDNGVVVGTMRASGGVSKWHAWVYVDGVVTNLNTLIQAGTGLHIAFANAVNDAGQIAATAFDAQGRYHAVLLTPGNGPPPTPTVSVGDASVFEGHTGTQSAGFLLTISPMTTAPVTVAYNTVNGTATAGTDYDAVSSTVTIPAGRTTWAVYVTVRGDRRREGDEVFRVDLSSATGATIADGQAVGTIRDDDK